MVALLPPFVRIMEIWAHLWVVIHRIRCIPVKCFRKIKNNSRALREHQELLTVPKAATFWGKTSMEFHKETEVHQEIKEPWRIIITNNNNSSKTKWPSQQLLMVLIITICLIWKTKIRIIKTTLPQIRIHFSRCNNNQHSTAERTSLNVKDY